MNEELPFVKEMFDKIAPRYDFLNRLLSARQDVMWREQMVRAAKLFPGDRVLDVACGTCDVGLEILSQLKGRAQVTGLDFSYGMLRLGQKKLGGTQDQSIGLVNGDALALPVHPDLFDAIFIAFGIRNIMNREKAVRQFKTALKPGGRLVILELTTPSKGLLKKLYLAYFKGILPLIGRFFSKHGNAYSYLPESVMKFPDPVSFSRMMAAQGFSKVRFKEMTFGIVTLFVGKKL